MACAPIRRDYQRFAMRRHATAYPCWRACRGMGYCYKVSMLFGGDEDDGAVTAFFVYLHRYYG